jgi:hypothetical protein
MLKGLIVNAYVLEPLFPGFGYGHGQVFRVVVVFLRIEEDLRAMNTILRRLDEHLHHGLPITPAGYFEGEKWHGGTLDSMVGQEDCQ